MARNGKRVSSGLLTDEIIQQIMAYVPGWIDTIGVTGAPPKKGGKASTDPRTRAASAKIGLDLFGKVIATGGEMPEKSKSLLDDLNTLGEQAESIGNGNSTQD